MMRRNPNGEPNALPEVLSFYRLLVEGLALTLDEAIDAQREAGARLDAVRTAAKECDEATAAVLALGMQPAPRRGLKQHQNLAAQAADTLYELTGHRDVQAAQAAAEARVRSRAGAGRARHLAFQQASIGVGRAPCGVYAFYDFEGDPMYVGRTREGVSTRVRRHLTNQRTDAVAMGAIDPREVAEVEIWPIWPQVARAPRTGGGDEEGAGAGVKQSFSAEVDAYLASLEGTVASHVELDGAMLFNEKIIPREKNLAQLPASVRFDVVAPGERSILGHPDLRIARRARTVAHLAGKIADRSLRDTGLRKSLQSQLESLTAISDRRYNSLGGDKEAAKSDGKDGG